MNTSEEFGQLAQLASDLFLLGRKAMDQREFERAITLFRCSADLQPHFKTLELLGECLIELNRGESSEAIVSLAAAAGLGNNAARAFFLLGRALLLRGELQDASEKLDAAISINPDFKAAKQLREELKKQNIVMGRPEKK